MTTFDPERILPMQKKQTKATLSLITAMLIFGSVGIFRRYIPLPSAAIAGIRGIVGMLFLLGFMAVRGRKPSLSAIRKNLVHLCLSGAFIGINWILLFEAYNYTTVSCATLCYYTAPVYVILLSPLILKDRITPARLCCTVCALFGMVLVSGIVGDGGDVSLRGILLGLGAAIFYAAVVLTNKTFRDIEAFDRTVIQLGVAGVAVLPYSVIAEGGAIAAAIPEMTALPIVMLIIMAVVHTGVAYALYFGSFMHLKAQTAALFSYIDPVAALVLSALILGETMTLTQIIGAVLIIGSAAIGEIVPKKKGEA